MNKNTNKNLEKLFEEFTNSSHHAFLFESNNREIDYEYFKNRLEKENTDQNENLFLNLKVLDINKAREILEYGKTNFEKQHFILISFYSINREAQNSLLKFLEETSENIKVLFIIHSGAKILNTIYSRMYKLTSSSKEENRENDFDNLAKEFLKTKKLSRMKLKEITELLAKKDEYALENEDKERSDREVVERFLLSLHKKIFDFYKTKREKDLLDSLDKIKENLKYVKNNSSSGKTILEYLSLKLPEIN